MVYKQYRQNNEFSILYQKKNFLQNTYPPTIMINLNCGYLQYFTCGKLHR